MTEIPGRERLLLVSLIDEPGSKAGVDQLVHVFRLEVLLGLGRVDDEVTRRVVPVDGTSVVTGNITENRTRFW